MERKKKRSIETTLIQGHHESEPPVDLVNSEMVEAENRLNQPVQVKAERNVKEESQLAGELDDVPVPVYNNQSVGSSFDAAQSDGKYDFEMADFEDVKIEVKKEGEEKKDKKSKTKNDSDGDAINNQHDQQQPPPQNEANFIVPESDHDAKNPEASKADDPEKLMKEHKCDICEYSTEYKNNLDRHVITHTGKKPHACNFCPKRFTQKRYLRYHMKVHIEEFLFHCPGCLQGFDAKNEKIAHEINCKVSRYECHLCKESFGSRKENMIRHMHVHSGNKPFECKECFKQFTRKDSFNKHLKLHAGPRTFRCSNCRLLFSHQEERNAHEEKCNRPKFECNVCGKSFGLKKCHLIRHMRIHSGETPFECQHCLKQYKHKFSLNRHTATHTKKLSFKCLICRQGFSKENKRKAHQRNCNGRYYECYLCKKFFKSFNQKLKDHMHTHSGEKRFHCELCRNKFTSKTNLKRHMKNIHSNQN